MDVEKILTTMENLVLAKTNTELTEIQKAIIRGSLLEKSKTYDQIAVENRYSPQYVKQVVAPSVWQLLSAALGAKVNKKTCISILEKELERLNFHEREAEIPGGPMSCSSPYYIERTPHQNRCYQHILKPGSFCSIQAPKRMGKTSLMLKVMAYAKQQGYRVVALNLERADNSILSDFDKFLRWLMASLIRKLGILPIRDNSYNVAMGSKSWCTSYLIKHLLSQIDRPLVIALDDVELLFSYYQNTRDFFQLLHSWYEEAAYDLEESESWQKLRVILVYSTEAWIDFNINDFPFQFDLELELSPFTQLQVEDLAMRHQLHLKSEKIEQLIQLLGGHPYLIHLSLYLMGRGELTFEELRETAATDTGIFGKHLHRYLWHLQQHPELAKAFKKVALATTGIELEPILGEKLKNLGLVNLEGNCATVTGDLYRQYLSDRLF